MNTLYDVEPQAFQRESGVSDAHEVIPKVYTKDHRRAHTRRVYTRTLGTLGYNVKQDKHLGSVTSLLNGNHVLTAVCMSQVSQCYVKCRWC